MRLGCTYISVADIDGSLKFYQQLLQMEPTCVNAERWFSFACGNTFALYNPAFDEQLIQENRMEGRFNDAYLEDFRQNKQKNLNDTVILNFVVDDVQKEYERLKQLNLGELSELMYVNIVSPYWYFNIKDPDGNLLEITGE